MKILFSNSLVCVPDDNDPSKEDEPRALVRLLVRLFPLSADKSEKVKDAEVETKETERAHRQEI